MLYITGVIKVKPEAIETLIFFFEPLVAATRHSVRTKLQLLQGASS
ncbi:hypothetical protein POKO110462_18150 [Pontibacter korlensis]